jgi:hypothetical protein
MANLPRDTGDDDQGKKQDDVVGMPAGAKEKGAGVQEKTPVTEYTRRVDLEPEVEGWLEKLEKEEAQLQQPVVDDKGQVVLDDAQKKKKGFKVVLPLSKDEVEKGLHHKVIDSLRWLAEWCTRMIKMFGNKVAYRKK